MEQKDAQSMLVITYQTNHNSYLVNINQMEQKEITYKQTKKIKL